MENVRRWCQSATSPSTKRGEAYGQPQQPRASIGQGTTRAYAAEKNREIETSERGDLTHTKRLGVYIRCISCKMYKERQVL